MGVSLNSSSRLAADVLGPVLWLVTALAAVAGPRYEAGSISVTQSDAAAWSAISFAAPFPSPPVVVLGPASLNEAQPVTVRVRNVTTTGFEVQIDEWDYLDGVHPAETLSFLALEAGVHQIGGRTWEAGRVAGAVREPSPVALTGGFTGAPVVLVQAETRNNAQALRACVDLVTATSFQLRLQTQQTDATALVGESAGFIAIAPGDGQLDGVPFRAARTRTVVRHSARTISFGGTYRQPLFFAQTQTSNDGEACTIRRRTLASTSASILLQEEQSSDPDSTHAAEEVGWLVLAETHGEIRANLEVGSFHQAQAASEIWHPATFDQPYARPVAMTYASGIATLYLNGPKNAARVSLSFSGLTSNQTNAYLRYGVPAGVGPELRPTLPIGQVVAEPWNIIPAGAFSGQEIIDGLFQIAGKYVYLNVGTGNYPAGEISGIWSRQTGSTTFIPPPDPPPIATLTGDALTRDVARFLTQATFGPSQAEIAALAAAIQSQHGGDRLAGFGAWIDDQFARDQTLLYDYTFAADQQEWALRGTTPAAYTGNNEPRHHNRRRGWWLLSARAHDQLRQRIAFALSEIFVVSESLSTLQQRHYGLASYYDLLGRHADGKYRDLLEEVSKSPMMGKWLSHLKNQKAVVDPQTGQVIISPDENYAREVMQLFSIGLVQRHPDGTLKLGPDGQPIPTYDNNDITELARVLTGWSFSKRHGAASAGYPVVDNTNFNQGEGPRYFQASWLNPMKNFAAFHDTGAKQVLGASIPAGLDGETDLDAALEILANHPNVAPFISRLLVQRLVTSNPSTGYIYRVARKFMDNGSGVRGDLKAVVKAILLDYEARTLEVTTNVGYGKQKEPILRYLQLIRALDARSQIPLTSLSSYGYPAAQLDNFPAGVTLLRYPATNTPLGQTPQSSPTVFNWFLPDFNPGGAIAGAGLAAPEMQLTTETSVSQAINYHYTVVQIDAGQSVDALFGSTSTTEDNVAIDRTPFVQLYDAEISAGKTVTQAVTTVLDQLDLVLASGNLRAKYSSAAVPNPRSIMIAAVASMSVNSAARVKEVLYLLVTSPEYIHQK